MEIIGVEPKIKSIKIAVTVRKMSDPISPV